MILSSWGPYSHDVIGKLMDLLKDLFKDFLERKIENMLKGIREDILEGHFEDMSKGRVMEVIFTIQVHYLIPSATYRWILRLQDISSREGECCIHNRKCRFHDPSRLGAA